MLTRNNKQLIAIGISMSWDIPPATFKCFNCAGIMSVSLVELRL